MALQAVLAVNTLVKVAEDEFRDTGVPFDPESYELALKEHPEYSVVFLHSCLCPYYPP